MFAAVEGKTAEGANRVGGHVLIANRAEQPQRRAQIIVLALHPVEPDDLRAYSALGVPAPPARGKWLVCRA
jgi:hypothetical protein